MNRNGAGDGTAQVSRVLPDAPVDTFAGAADAGAGRGLIAAIDDIVDGVAVLDPLQATRQPDWTQDPVDSGQWPANRLDDPRVRRA